MENELYNAFDKIRAEDALKEKTARFLRESREKSRARAVPRMRAAAVCVSFLLLIFCGGFFSYLYFTPAAYVDIDVNPSVGLALNRFGRVLEASPYNGEGAEALRGADVRNKTWEQAVRALLDAMIREGYLKPDGLVAVTVQAGDSGEEQEMLKEARASVGELLASHHSAASADIFAVSRETRDSAHAHNLSPAKYLAIAELQEVDPTATFEGCAEHSIREIRELTEEHHSEPPDAAGDTASVPLSAGHGGRRHHGHKHG